MMMRDLETGTVWQQSTGEPEAGPRRVPLAMLLVELTTWEEWRREHPETTIVVEPPRPRVDYRRLLPVATLFEKGPRLIAAMPNRGPRDARLPGIEEVVSVTVAGAVRAYPCRVVAERGVVLDEVGGRGVALLHDPGSGRIRAFALPASSPVVALEPDGMLRGDPDRSWDARGRAGDGGEPLEPIAVKRELWHSWSEFHPNADLYVG